MRIPDIRLNDISRFRGEHMGVAIIIIVLFHVFVPRSSEFYCLKRMGNLGVDIFLFLSGVGLWYSWTKEKAHSISGKVTEYADNTLPPFSWKAFMRKYAMFYWRRLKRVYPIWFIVACYYFIPRFNGDDWIDLFGDILINWGFWLHDELKFWYVPAIMMLYVIAPPYIELIRRHDTYRWIVVLTVVWCIIVQYVTPVHNAVGHIEIFWSRIPIFLIGINMGEMIRQRKTLEGSTLWLIIITFIMTLTACLYLEQVKHGLFPLFLERMIYIPLAITFLILLNMLLCKTPAAIRKALAWVGSISLEIYLIHMIFILTPLTHYHLGYWTTFFLTMVITLPIAWTIQQVINKIMSLTVKRK